MRAPLNPPRKYDVVWVVQGTVRETIAYNLPIALAKYKMSGIVYNYTLPGIICLRDNLTGKLLSR